MQEDTVTPIERIAVALEKIEQHLNKLANPPEKAPYLR